MTSGWEETRKYHETTVIEEFWLSPWVAESWSHTRLRKYFKHTLQAFFGEKEMFIYICMLCTKRKIREDMLTSILKV